jgi:gliding motility-associated-like protein
MSRARLIGGLLFCATLYFSVLASAQVYCPSNINLENGNFSFWTFDTGTNYGIKGITSKRTFTPLRNRETVTSGSDTDFYGGFRIVDPLDGSYSLKLGNDSTGAQVDIARYTFTVPGNINSYRINYRYAVVFEDPKHAPYDQPFFRVRIYDATTNDTLACASSTYVSNSSLPGFQLSHRMRNGPVYYKPWSSVGINLNNQGGKTLTIEFTVADCSQSGHMGYAYVDMKCGRFDIINHDTMHCRITIPLSAPEGFQDYVWYNDDYSKIVNKGKDVNLPADSSLQTYHVVLGPFPGFGCDDTLTTSVRSQPLKIEAGADRKLCVGESTALQATGADSYVWSPFTGLSCDSCAAPLAAPETSMLYHVIGTNKYGCNGIDSVQINVVPHVPVQIDSAHSICRGDSIRIGITTAATWQWLPPVKPADVHSSNPLVYPDTSTTYSVVVTENECFTDTLSQGITVLPRPTVSLGPDITGLVGQTVTLRADAQNTSAITWFPPEGLSCNLCYQTQHVIAGNKTYVVIVSNELNCTATDTINIIAACKGQPVYLPNTFTPNADGANDRFYPHGPPLVPVSAFMIYDRWGEKVFSATNISMNNPAAGWDGVYQNKPLAPDVYIYVMEISCELGKKIVLTGDISLLR